MTNKIDLILSQVEKSEQLRICPELHTGVYYSCHYSFIGKANGNYDNHVLTIEWENPSGKGSLRFTEKQIEDFEIDTGASYITGQGNGIISRYNFSQGETEEFTDPVVTIGV